MTAVVLPTSPMEVVTKTFTKPRSTTCSATLYRSRVGVRALFPRSCNNWGTRSDFFRANCFSEQATLPASQLCTTAAASDSGGGFGEATHAFFMAPDDNWIISPALNFDIPYSH